MRKHAWVVGRAVLVWELVVDVLVLTMVLVCTEDIDVPTVNVCVTITVTRRAGLKTPSWISMHD